jgi:hypothetical protein
MDGHTQYAKDYVDASLSAWQPAMAVGGPMVARGSAPWQRAIGNAMEDPLAIGPARFHHAMQVEEVDTVYLGAYSRTEFLEVGGYRTFKSGTVEDTDFYSRWRGTGRIVLVHPTIRSFYEPRATWRGLRIQYFRYGQGKAELLRLNRSLPSIRPLAPAALVLGLFVALALGPTVSWVPLAVLTAMWMVALLVVGARAASNRIRTMAAAATMHFTYGLGFWVGLFGRGPVLRDE